DVEEQRSLRYVGKAMGTTEGIFLGNASDRERLARESRQKHVMVRHIVFVDLCDVGCEDVVRAIMEVRGIGLPGVGVPLAGEHAAATLLLERSTDAPDAGEKIDEGEFGRLLR